MTIAKDLTKNDLGETGAHQAGLHVPKSILATGLFPKFAKSVKNPRLEIIVEDEAKKKWSLNLIYYNNKYFGGTRNEVRLTGVSGFFKRNTVSPGDTIIFQRRNNKYFVKIKYKERHAAEDNISLRLSSSWRTLDI